MPRCKVCGTSYPEGELFCELDGAALLSEAPSLPKLPAELIGTMVGTYRLTRKLGEGGMGVIYEAVHPVLERRIAIKIIHPSHARDPETVQRFLDEARALGRIRHPNIVDVQDLGQLADGTVFLEMELLSGRDLRARLKAGPLLPEELRGLFLQIASGLEAAHATGVIHRDLKPENIFLCEGGGVKLLDFGVVKLIDNEFSFSRTRTGMIMGTPEYMSPEQAAGRRDLDHRSDIYSFGLLLYEALAGRRPFDAETLYDILSKQVTETFPRPEERAGRPVDAALSAIAMRCLAKEPSLRYRSMAEVHAALRGERIPAPPPASPSGAPRAVVPVARPRGGAEEGRALELTPGELRRGAPLALEMRVRGASWRRVDAVNVGELTSEEAHAFTCKGPLTRARMEANFPNGRRLADEGVIHKAEISLRFFGLTPGKETLLLLRLDVGQRQDVETLVDGVVVAARPHEVDAVYRWRHETILLPGSQVKKEILEVTRRPKSGASNLYAAWVYQVV